ncbi:MAG: FtsX-like permease family protein [Treponema sp.]|nr:FtsX-like permease family protein [Treponema sp.]
MIWQLILRNGIRNRKSNSVILLLIGSIAFLFFVGNSLIGRTVQSMRDTFINGVTGDVVIEKSGDVTMNLFGANMAVVNEYFSIPVLPAYNALVEIVAAEPHVASMTSQVSGQALLDFGSYRAPALLCGVDPDTYFPLFPSIELVEGRFLLNGEFGAMISREKALAIERETGKYPGAGEKILLTSAGIAGFKIREVSVSGVYQYKNAGQFMNEIVITDAQTARVLTSIQVASSDAEAGEGAASLMASGIDDLFGGDSVDFLEPDEEMSPDAVSSFLSEAREKAPARDVGGEWNFIIVRLNKGLFSSTDSFINDLNKKLSPYGVVAVNWQIAAGESAVMLIILQTLFNSGISLVSIVGVIAVINILLISVFKRKREIGTLRSIGAADRFIRRLFWGENLALSCVSGLAGVLAGTLFFQWINSMRIAIPNALLVSLLGGDVLNIEFFPQSAVAALALAVILSFGASIYPVEEATRIEPAAALRDLRA